MDTLSRKLFKTRDARKTLRDMGGIMSSSPELAQEVQRFQDGALVTAPSLDYGTVSLPQLAASANQGDSQARARLMQMADEYAASFGGRDPEGARQQFLNRAGFNPVIRPPMRPDDLTSTPPVDDRTLVERYVDPGLIETLGIPTTTEEFLGGFTNQDPQPTTPGPVAEGPAMTFEELVAQNAEGIPPTASQILASEELLSENQIGLVMAMSEGGFFPSPEQISDAMIPDAPERFVDADPNTGVFELTPAGQGVADTVADAARGVGRSAEDAVRGIFLGDTVGALEMREEERADRDAAREEERQPPAGPLTRPNNSRDAAADDTPVVEPAADDTPVVEPDATPAATPAATEAATAEIDFDASFAQAQERIGAVMGDDSDEDSRKKAMANLAMIGLAIAAGQSPNALTNIAQGALAGMQGIQRSEAAEKAAQREANLSALEMANADVRLDRQLASAERIAGMRARSTGSTFSPQDRLYNATFQSTYDYVLQDSNDPAAALEAARTAATASAPGSSQAGAGPLGRTPTQIVTQNGVRFQLYSDGSSEVLGD
mgnify:CR=1 FL=1